MQDKFRETFQAEALELLQTLEGLLLDLEKDPADRDAVASVFRVMHTIKGSGAMFGYQHISSFTHEIESVMDAVRQGKRSVEPELIDILLLSRDHIRTLLEEVDPPPQELQGISSDIIRRLGALAGGSSSAAPNTDRADAEETTEQSGHQSAHQNGAHSRGLTTYRIRFVPPRDLYHNGTNPLNLLGELRELGECTCIPYLNSLPDLGSLNPEECWLHWDVILTTTASVEQISDVFMFVQDNSEIKIDPVDDLSFEELKPSKRLGQILVERGVIKQEQLNAALEKQRRLGQVLATQGVDPDEIQAALEEQNHIRRSRQRVVDDAKQQSVRVPSDKLDTLIDLVGELVTLQARVQQTAGDMDNPTLATLSENLQRITDELRDSTLSVRMLPIESAFSKFRRLVRDLSQQVGKKVELVTVGGETEMDKTVLERLTDPLLHVIRNSIDHGIEDSERRIAVGKPAAGMIELAAEHVGANVVLTITDDGKGLDRDAIFQKAVERGLVSASSGLNDSEITDLLTAPGFSTAGVVTEVSGRGVGMDVVKQQVESLGGSLTVGDAHAGGTRVALTLPLTLAIIEGLLIRIGDNHYVIPLGVVEECVEWAGSRQAQGEKRSREQGPQVMHLRESLVSVLQLRTFFRVQESAPERQQVVVVQQHEQLMGLVVDEVIGKHQTVIKNLGSLYRDISGISGATILGDGSVALILDIQRLSAEVTRIESGVTNG